MTSNSAGARNSEPIAGRVTISDPSLHENFLQPVDVICQAASRLYHTRLQYLLTPHCIIYKEAFQFGVTATGALPAPYYALCIPLHLTGDASFGKQRFAVNTIAFSDAGALHAVIAPGQEHVTLLIHKSFARNRLSDSELLQLKRCAQSRQITTSSETIAAFGAWLSRLLQCCQVWHTNNTQVALRQAEDDMVSWLSFVINQAGPGCPPPAKRITALSRAMNWLNATDTNVHISTHDLHRAAAVSQRTLERAFVENFQQTAREFLLKRRLHNVRRLLLENEKDTLLVKEAAITCGFYDLGRFSQYYKRFFRETPSQTLARRATSLSPDAPSLHALQQTTY